MRRPRGRARRRAYCCRRAAVRLAAAAARPPLLSASCGVVLATRCARPQGFPMSRRRSLTRHWRVTRRLSAGVYRRGCLWAFACRPSRAAGAHGRAAFDRCQPIDRPVGFVPSLGPRGAPRRAPPAGLERTALCMWSWAHPSFTLRHAQQRCMPITRVRARAVSVDRALPPGMWRTRHGRASHAPADPCCVGQPGRRKKQSWKLTMHYESSSQAYGQSVFERPCRGDVCHAAPRRAQLIASGAPRAPTPTASECRRRGSGP